MSSSTRIFILNNIKISVNASPDEAFSIARKRLAKLNIRCDDSELSVYKQSIDARKKNDIKFVYSVAVRGIDTYISESLLKEQDASVIDESVLPDILPGDENMDSAPLIVGAGPAGLFAALMLAERGYAPTVIERGASVAERKRCVERFYREHLLDSDSNIQFGAGGAGTFSDGKLVTRINDPMSSYVLKQLVRFGAPGDILYSSRPHIGTDILSQVIDRIIREIDRLGGRVLFRTKYLGSSECGGNSIALTSNGEIKYSSLILAIGHSARDTYHNLISSDYSIDGKPFSVGMRIEHLRKNIDTALYGDFAGHPNLGAAEYNLSYNTKERGVYTFCMCPGGEVVAAASEECGVVVNGMSPRRRDLKNSNSAVVCSIFREDYGGRPEQAIEYQRKIERAAYIAGGGAYSAPNITVGDFLSDKCTAEPTDVVPSYMNGSNVKLALPSDYLPSIVCSSIKNALSSFDRKIKGFASHSAILTGAETRTSAPIRILRDNETRLAIGKKNVYPCGEGAGYAGGITSAAIDGLKTAIAVIRRFKPNSSAGEI